MMRNILVTGAAGFCGQHLIDRIAAIGGENIVGVDIHGHKPGGLPCSSYFTVDIYDQAQVKELVRTVRPRFVFHLAGRNKGDPLEIFRANLMGSICLLDAIRCFVPEARVLMVGSAAEYGHMPAEAMPIREGYACNPQGSYGISKHCMTLAALDYSRNYGLKVVVARPFNIVGAGAPPTLVVGAILARIRRAFESGKEECVIEVGNLDPERDFLAVQDVIDAYLRLIQGEFWGEIFNVCSGVPRPIRKVVEELLSNCQRPVRLHVNPELIRSDDVSFSYGSFEKLQRVCGWEPKTLLRTALKEAWTYVLGDST